MIDFESILPTESLDVANIVRGILKVQAQFAAQQSRALGRGTHTKGICARATFEVFDVARTIADPSIAARLAHGIYAIPGVYPAPGPLPTLRRPSTRIARLTFARFPFRSNCRKAHLSVSRALITRCKALPLSPSMMCSSSAHWCTY